LNDKLHREDGPAIEYANGTKEWYKNGKLHREDGPAVECADGTKEWHKNDKRHREDGPAVELADGTKFWYLNGKKVTEQEVMNSSTMTVDNNGTKQWRNKRGQLHREDGPAIEYTSGGKSWWLHGKCHREDGPAIENADGDKIWYLNDQLHREDGPAVEDADGTKEWWLNGEEVTEQEVGQEAKIYYVEDDELHHYGPFDDYDDACQIADRINGRIVIREE